MSGTGISEPEATVIFRPLSWTRLRPGIPWVSRRYDPEWCSEGPDWFTPEPHGVSDPEAGRLLARGCAGSPTLRVDALSHYEPIRAEADAGSFLLRLESMPASNSLRPSAVPVPTAPASHDSGSASPLLPACRPQASRLFADSLVGKPILLRSRRPGLPSLLPHPATALHGCLRRARPIRPASPLRRGHSAGACPLGNVSAKFRQMGQSVGSAALNRRPTGTISATQPAVETRTMDVSGQRHCRCPPGPPATMGRYATESQCRRDSCVSPLCVPGWP